MACGEIKPGKHMHSPVAEQPAARLLQESCSVPSELQYIYGCQGMRVELTPKDTKTRAYERVKGKSNPGMDKSEKACTTMHNNRERVGK